MPARKKSSGGRGAPKTKRCPVLGCNQCLTPKVIFHCAKCKQDVCIEHQYPIDHGRLIACATGVCV
eukprot:COSAG01_NODE_1510_length_10078_cov_424.420910_3_plen_66_part_00